MHRCPTARRVNRLFSCAHFRLYTLVARVHVHSNHEIIIYDSATNGDWTSKMLSGTTILLPTQPLSSMTYETEGKPSAFVNAQIKD